MTRTAIIAHGSWPARMPAQLAAGYCGEPSTAEFLVPDRESRGSAEQVVWGNLVEV